MAQISYTVAEAAKAVGLSERSVRDAIKDSYLTARFFNTKALIRHEDLEAWIDKLPSESPR
ncbi:helix-turn-helix domain-containing protein [Pseudarthrobacter sp. NIBRBAC000502772]|uniref:helix-turn-helix domain-containing protein n=1 Tax=Pseudarthrobacter sp. NIBRBAC000502772 TaxID=2590775 RepID=UPI001131DD15|nr:helix-turn-helix domain-containing protein [Pseudarthrobacter sp. NIBRBAC000502772]